jgi:prevent-host-death family protein
MQQIIGVTEFQRKFRSFFEDVVSKHIPLVLTRGSRPEAVLIPYEDYLRFQQMQESEVLARFDRVWNRLARVNATAGDAELAADIRALAGQGPGRVSGESVKEKNFHIQNEERLVAELEQLGVGYLSRQTDKKATRTRLPHKILADLVQQPSSRVRTALIALLLAQPSFADHIPAALEILPPEMAQTLKFLSTAAVLLQRQFASSLQPFFGSDWRWLPDLFSTEFKLPSGAPVEQLKALAKIHQLSTGMNLNWAGTYENAARNLIRRWELEQAWNR